MIPLSDAIIGFVQDELKKKYPGFGLWLFATEIAGMTALAFVAGKYVLGPVIYLAVRGLMFRSYLKKHRKRGKAPTGEAVFNVCAAAATVGVVAGIFLAAMFAVPVPNVGYDPAADAIADQDMNMVAPEMNATGDFYDSNDAVAAAERSLDMNVMNELAANEAEQDALRSR